MMETDVPVSDDDLHAFVDGQLDASRVAAVLQHLRRHPDAAVRVAHWHAQRFALRRLHHATDIGPAPAALADTVLRHGRRRWNPWIQACAAVLLVVVGAAGMRAWQAGTDVAGRAGGAASMAAASTTPQFVRDAAAAYAVFSPEVRHPVEVGAQEEAHLVQWLSRRLGRPLAAPTLQDRGFRLLGGRLLSGEGVAQDTAKAAAARAQFMYEDERGRRVTLYVAVFPAGVAPRETAFRSVQSAGGTAFYWVENGYGYALNGDLPPNQLQALASDVYDQLFPR
ncbi:Anti-sigma factor [Bordetella sputigena]|uniref:anti-sigma factor family protein n=1 Tax=Bordetella sputigena TaxID=1416810 RepID=UPI0039F10431